MSSFSLPEEFREKYNASTLINFSLIRVLERIEYSFLPCKRDLVGRVYFILEPTQSSQINVDIEGLEQSEKTGILEVIEFNHDPNIGMEFSLILLSQLYNCGFSWEIYTPHNARSIYLRISNNPSKLKWYDAELEAIQGQDDGYIMRGDGKGKFDKRLSYSIPEGL